MLNYHMSKEELRVAYDEYLEEHNREYEETGIYKPVLSIHQFRCQGMLFFPTNVEAPKKEKELSKAEIARKIFDEEVLKGPLVRSVVIKRFIEEAGCTTAGAGTYYANCVNNQKKSLLTKTEKAV